MMDGTRLQFLLFRALFLCVLLLGGWLAHHHSTEFDWSLTGSNRLSPASEALLERLSGRVEITAFARDEPVLRRRISNIVGRYQRAKSDVELRYVDPDRHPDVVRGLGITRNGELLVRYRGGERKVQSLTEAALSNTLTALDQRDRRTIRYLVGHGERSLTGTGNHDLGEIGRSLRSSGVTIEALDLIAEARIPDDTSLLVIAGPRTPLAGGEIALIGAYLEGGGNLLWLADPLNDADWSTLESVVGIHLLDGTVVDSATRIPGLEERAFTLVTEYPDHPITAELDSPTLFPLAAALELRPGADWEATALLESSSTTWTETEPGDDAPTLDVGRGERQGPHVVGAELVRDGPTGTQRVIVIGDGDFLANAYLGNGGNLQLGMNLFNWLTSESPSLDIVPQLRPDTHLDFSQSEVVTIGAMFLVLLPCTLVGCGVLSWWRRRHG
jgi:ABC-type uncharacterized transport system involved in gliding motility auxiliary subunit